MSHVVEDHFTKRWSQRTKRSCGSKSRHNKRSKVNSVLLSCLKGPTNGCLQRFLTLPRYTATLPWQISDRQPTSDPLRRCTWCTWRKASPSCMPENQGIPKIISQILAVYHYPIGPKIWILQSTIRFAASCFAGASKFHVPAIVSGNETPQDYYTALRKQWNHVDVPFARFPMVLVHQAFIQGWAPLVRIHISYLRHLKLIYKWVKELTLSYICRRY